MEDIRHELYEKMTEHTVPKSLQNLLKGTQEVKSMDTTDINIAIQDPNFHVENLTLKCKVSGLTMNVARQSEPFILRTNRNYR